MYYRLYRGNTTSTEQLGTYLWIFAIQASLFFRFFLSLIF